MADDIDNACEREQQDRERAIQQARVNTIVIAATGYCLECDEEVTKDKRWCDQDCRDTWQRWNTEA